jgi:hypothetical protein
MKLIVCEKIKILTQSEALKENWMKKRQRGLLQKTIMSHMLESQDEVALPCLVKLTRIAPEKIEFNQNIALYFKTIIETISEWLAPEMPIPHPEIHLAYGEEIGAEDEHAVRIEIYE